MSIRSFYIRLLMGVFLTTIFLLAFDYINSSEDNKKTGPMGIGAENPLYEIMLDGNEYEFSE